MYDTYKILGKLSTYPLPLLNILKLGTVRGEIGVQCLESL